MRNHEQSTLPGAAEPKESQQERHARRIAEYIGTKVIGANASLDAKEEEDIRAFYQTKGVRERAEALYEKMMAYMVDRRAEADQHEPVRHDPYLISEIKVLFGDPEVKRLIPSTYGEARVDVMQFRASELGKLWTNLRAEIQGKEKRFQELERKVHLHQIEGRGNISTAKTHMARLAENLTALEQRKKDIETLSGFPETKEHTDIAAQLQYEQLRDYQRQLQEGFVWLPSRKRIHQETVNAILNHRWPVLIGEAGTGKSDQADAAARELTGYAPTEIECESITGEGQLIAEKDIDPVTKGGYDTYGPLMQAFTGYADSREKNPSVMVGRIARFDESGRLGPKAYSIIKKARQKKAGEDFYGHPMLAGAGAIWTSNPVGPRYPDRHPPDPAMRRELAEIRVDYPDMSIDNPELYEFALTALLDDNGHIAAAREELAPNFGRVEIPEEKRESLEDGSVVVAREMIAADMADAQHGALWRFCGAIKTLQESFVYGNAQTEKYPETLLRYKDNEDDTVEVTTDGSGQPLTLHSSTVTLGELGSWMSGYNERRQKQDPGFRVETLTEWLNFKIGIYVKQVDPEDKEKVKAIFKHFHFLEDRAPDVRHAKPMTPEEIGYLSPRVPRPVYVEKPKPPDVPPVIEAGKPTAAVEKKTDEVVLESGKRINISVKSFKF